MSKEHAHLKEAKEQNIPWKKWGPYLSERQWGTVREDYSEHGIATVSSKDVLNGGTDRAL